MVRQGFQRARGVLGLGERGSVSAFFFFFFVWGGGGEFWVFRSLELFWFSGGLGLSPLKP